MHAIASEMKFLAHLKKIITEYEGMDLFTRRLRLRLLPGLIDDWSRGDAHAKRLVAECLRRLAASVTMDSVRTDQRQYEQVQVMPPPPAKPPRSQPHPVRLVV